MRVFRNIADFSSDCRPVATVGVFDGVHLGHQEIIRQLVLEAYARQCEAIAVTFDPHPRLVLQPETNVQLLQTPDEKLAYFEKAGVDTALVIPFTPQFAKTSPEKFITEILVKRLNVSHIITGYDHFFGQGKQGNIQLLESMGEKYNFSVSELPKVTIGGLTVSSSNIRNALLNGEVENASNMLGYPYTLQGRVVKGNKIGSNIGFPTANLKPDDPHKLTPGQGVYATKVMVNELIYNSMTNIGFRPTIDADHLTIETHIFNFDQDIYDSRIDLSFVARIRNEKRFTSLGNLQVQLAVDSVIAHKLLGMK